MENLLETETHKEYVMNSGTFVGNIIGLLVGLVVAVAVLLPITQNITAGLTTNASGGTAGATVTGVAATMINVILPLSAIVPVVLIAGAIV